MVASSEPHRSDPPARPADRPTESTRRVLFYSHDGTGLGHLRITLGVAAAYSELRPFDSLLLLTGSLHTSAFALPENLDYVKLPAMPKREVYASLPPIEGYTGSHNSTIRFRTAVALATVQGFDPHLIVVDHAPAGLFRELAPSLEWLRHKSPRTRFALLMRDITFGLEQTRAIWRNEEVYPLLDEVYDRILVYGEQAVFDPITAYAMSERAAARTHFCGFLPPSPPRRSPEEVRREIGAGDRPLVVVSVGGGHDGGPVLRAYLEGLRQRPDTVFSYVVLGPLLSAGERAEMLNLADSLAHVRLIDFDPDFTAAVRAADAVVCMGGYNSVIEAVYFGKRPIVVPRMPGPEEQILRAAGFARLDLATCIDPRELSADRLWEAVEDALRRPLVTTRQLSFDGLTQTARELTALAAI